MFLPKKLIKKKVILIKPQAGRELSCVAVDHTCLRKPTDLFYLLAQKATKGWQCFESAAWNNPAFLKCATTVSVKEGTAVVTHHGLVPACYLHGCVCVCVRHTLRQCAPDSLQQSAAAPRGLEAEERTGCGGKMKVACESPSRPPREQPVHLIRPPPLNPSHHHPTT